MSQLDTIAREGASPIKGRQVITCADGFSLSINASRGGYCTPRADTGPYVSVEVGYPSGPVPAGWQQYAVPASAGKVYGWVPVEMVRRLIASHGGER